MNIPGPSRGVLSGGPLVVGRGFQPGDPDMKVLVGFEILKPPVSFLISIRQLAHSNPGTTPLHRRVVASRSSAAASASRSPAPPPRDQARRQGREARKSEKKDQRLGSASACLCVGTLSVA